MINNSEFQAYTEQVEQMVQRVNSLTDDDARAAALELLQSIMDLHGAVVSRIVEVLSDSGDAGRSALSNLGSDPLVCGLLVLYGIHPLSLEQRVNAAIEKVRPHLRKQGGGVDLVSVSPEGKVNISIHSSGNGCHSSPDALKSAIDQAILEMAPDVTSIEAEGASSLSSFVPLNKIQPAVAEDTRYEKSTA